MVVEEVQKLKIKEQMGAPREARPEIEQKGNHTKSRHGR